MFSLICLRLPNTDSEKYEALAVADQLATSARLSGNYKAPTYDAIASTLRDKLYTSKMQFKVYFATLLADK